MTTSGEPAEAICIFVAARRARRRIARGETNSSSFLLCSEDGPAVDDEPVLEEADVVEEPVRIVKCMDWLLRLRGGQRRVCGTPLVFVNCLKRNAAQTRLRLFQTGPLRVFTTILVRSMRRRRVHMYTPIASLTRRLDAVERRLERLEGLRRPRLARLVGV